MSDDHEQEYDDDLVYLLEAVWGAGYLSPGDRPDRHRILVRDCPTFTPPFPAIDPKLTAASATTLAQLAR